MGNSHRPFRKSAQTRQKSSVDSLEEAISAARKAKVSVVEEEMREARETVTPARSAALKKK